MFDKQEPKETPAPAPEPPRSSGAEQKVRAWKSGEKTVIEGVDGYEFNDLNVTFKEEKKQRKFRFNYDQENKVLVVVDDK
tara:strand:+ start:230 stop:469 length:240 start_codon:yes stop_codon:yes gene_type:complete